MTADARLDTKDNIVTILAADGTIDDPEEAQEESTPTMHFILAKRTSLKPRRK